MLTERMVRAKSLLQQTKSKRVRKKRKRRRRARKTRIRMELMQLRDHSLLICSSIITEDLS
jgi:hypothetical protein